jgi:RNA polymerase sigma factor (sigma-70 family)
MDVISGDMRTIVATEPLDDVRLVELSREGDREAFGRIIERYQSLICALTYSACGNFQASEDLAQVTFITAWCQLRNLREPAKLKSWLCSIARNATVNSFRQQGRTPTANAEALDSGPEISSDAPSPSDHVISKEEEAILWRSLGELPTTYREPLVLFYRQQQSIAEVADALELSEDAVKQRLSRGRVMLTEKVTAFVEGALRQTTPGRAFTLGVLAALPLYVTSAKAAAIGATAATGSAAAKAAAAVGLFGAFFAPVVGVLAGLLGTKISIDSAGSERDRQFRVKAAWINWSLALGFNVLMFGGIYFAGPYWKTHPVFLTWAVIVVAFGYVITILRLAIWSANQSRRINREAATDPLFNATGRRCAAYEYRSPWTLFGWPLIHIRFGEEVGKWQPAKGWIACGNLAYGILFAFGGVAVGGFSIGGVAIGGVAIGGFSLGLFSFGGLALGMLVMGGGAIGYMAWGGAAIAWLAALGGAAVGHHFALGGVAVAEHANDHAARAFVRDSVFFSHTTLLMTLALIVYCLSMLPGFLYFLKQSRRQRVGRRL